MSISTRKSALSGLALLGTSALLLAGCAAAPDAETPSTDSASDFLPCMISDAGGFDDQSFNQLGFEGLMEASDALGVTPITVESADETVYASNTSNLIDQDCDLIIAAGYLLADATSEAATANEDVNFAIVDDNSIDLPNVKPITFNTAEAAFLAGYAAASYSKTGVVGTYGGIPIASVTIFMDGFVEGVDYFNEQNSADVSAIGWNVDTQEGAFTGGFAAGVDSKTQAQNLIDQNADVILPVGGPIFLSAIEAITDSGKDIALIGVDGDLAENATSGNELFLTSVLKDITLAVSTVVTTAADDDFDATPYVGTLENEGVGLAEFHDFADKVSPDLQGELDEITAGIVDGSIVVESISTPQ